MSTGNWPQDESQQERPRKSGSSALKIFLIVAAVGGGLMVLCCGGFFFWARSRINMTQDATEVKARAQELAQIEIPARFSPALAMKMNFPGVPAMEMVVYVAGGKSGSLMLMDLKVPPGQGTIEGLEQQMIHSMSQQRGSEQIFRELIIAEKEDEEVEIRGQKVKVEYATGKDRASGDEYKQATLRFPGKAGSTTALIVQLPAEDWNDEEIEQMINSIK